ncbi:hypothetical protein B1H18_12230 [Streptomyces tsukubensis]|uniref:eCIS core domain-containing protein n=1 Tax=Streptomyces tsukubensis TaxID=83656 RepID=A0A1V4A9Z3_9ACTN|nr:hypothetical protein B1H18_12230 [Streptomyces tsukubensis]
MRGVLEPLFGADFGTVRIHESAQGPTGEAVACTRGDDIYFAPGAYRPDTARGREILGHELAHVLQQRADRTRYRPAAPALEAEAVLAGRTIARGRPVGLPGVRNALTAVARPVTQFYSVVGPADRAAREVTVARPSWTAGRSGDGDTFVGQDKRAGSSSFLLADGARTHLVSTDPATAVLRISSSGNMAIEHCTLNTRQPKVLYLSDTVLADSNAWLSLIGSAFRLAADDDAGQSLTVRRTVLRRVVPVLVDLDHPLSGFRLNEPDAVQSCDIFSQQILGKVANTAMVPVGAPPTGPGGSVAFDFARELLEPRPAAVDFAAPGADLTRAMRGIAIPYGNGLTGTAADWSTDLQRLGVNQFAAPLPAEVIATYSLTVFAEGVPPDPRPPTQTDYSRTEAGQPLVLPSDLVWGSHYAGVIARDGDDFVTMENYARSAEEPVAARQQLPGYFFQMYDSGRDAGARTWHVGMTTTPMVRIDGPVVPAPHRRATHTPASPGEKTFSNPLTYRSVLPVSHYEARATALYANAETVKDDHAALRNARTAQEQLAQALKGLRYAAVHLDAAKPRSGRKTRVDSWKVVTAAALAANTFPRNKPVLEHLSQRLERMTVS